MSGKDDHIRQSLMDAGFKGEELEEKVRRISKSRDDFAKREAEMQPLRDFDIYSFTNNALNEMYPNLMLKLRLSDKWPVINEYHQLQDDEDKLRTNINNTQGIAKQKQLAGPYFGIQHHRNIDIFAIGRLLTEVHKVYENIEGCIAAHVRDELRYKKDNKNLWKDYDKNKQSPGEFVKDHIDIDGSLIEILIQLKPLIEPCTALFRKEKIPFEASRKKAF